MKPVPCSGPTNIRRHRTKFCRPRFVHPCSRLEVHNLMKKSVNGRDITLFFLVCGVFF